MVPVTILTLSSHFPGLQLCEGYDERCIWNSWDKTLSRTSASGAQRPTAPAAKYYKVSPTKWPAVWANPPLPSRLDVIDEAPSLHQSASKSAFGCSSRPLLYQQMVCLFRLDGLQPLFLSMAHWIQQHNIIFTNPMSYQSKGKPRTGSRTK